MDEFVAASASGDKASLREKGRQFLRHTEDQVQLIRRSLKVAQDR